MDVNQDSHTTEQDKNTTRFDSRWHPYPAYKSSGVAWLGNIPAHWEVKRLKRLFTVTNGATPSSTISEYWDGDIAWITPDDLGKLQGDIITDSARQITRTGYESCGTNLVPAGSLVLSTRAPIGHLGIAGIELCTNQGCRCLVSRASAHAKYFYYQIKTAEQELQSWGQGSTFQELSKTRLETEEIVVPPFPEQRAIAAFLHRETAKLDDLIAKKERLIELLQEKRTALISHAVTKGLDPDVPMKDSGAAWLGRIPEHWNLARLKHITPEVTVGIVVTPAKFYVDTGVPCPRSLNIRDGMLTDNDLVFITAQGNEEHRKSIIHRADLLMVRSGQPGATAVVDERFDGANCIDLLIIRRSRHFNSSFLAYFANSPWARMQSTTGAGGAIQQHFNVETAKALVIVVPPLNEQHAIAAYLDRETTKIDALAAKVRQAIETLREYRTALISAAVTGKIDVRDEGDLRGFRNLEGLAPPTPPSTSNTAARAEGDLRARVDLEGLTQPTPPPTTNIDMSAAGDLRGFGNLEGLWPQALDLRGFVGSYRRRNLEGLRPTQTV